MKISVVFRIDFDFGFAQHSEHGQKTLSKAAADFVTNLLLAWRHRPRWRGWARSSRAGK